MGSHNSPQKTVSIRKLTFLLFLVFLIISGCSLPRLITSVGPQNETPVPPVFVITLPAGIPVSTDNPQFEPTPDPERILPAIRTQTETYIVRSGDTIISIAARYGIGPNTLAEANQLADPDTINTGLELTIPVPDPMPQGPENKLIPDSELVYGPSSVDFDIKDFISDAGGYLTTYSEELDGVVYSGADVINKVAQDFSVNPRLLLAILEYQSGWVTQPAPFNASLKNPLGINNTWRTGLYHQLIWAADNLNRGYYLWRVNGISSWVLLDEKVVPPLARYQLRNSRGTASFGIVIRV